VGRVGKDVYPCDAVGLAHNIGSVRGADAGTPPAHRSDGPGNRQRLRSSKVPCQPFGTGQISPHAALSPPYWVITQPRRLRLAQGKSARGRGHGKYSDRLLMLRRRRSVGRRGGRCGDRGIEPPASVFFGTDLIHRACQPQTLHAAASVRTRASGRASLTPVAASVVIAIRVADAGHHCPARALPSPVRLVVRLTPVNVAFRSRSGAAPLEESSTSAATTSQAGARGLAAR